MIIFIKCTLEFKCVHFKTFHYFSYNSCQVWLRVFTRYCVMRFQSLLKARSQWRQNKSWEDLCYFFQFREYLVYSSIVRLEISTFIFTYFMFFIIFYFWFVCFCSVFNVFFILLGFCYFFCWRFGFFRLDHWNTR